MKLPAIQFYPGDWLRDNVAGCSLAAQGLWLRMMFVAHDCDSYGKLSVSGRALLPAEIARRCGCSVEEFSLLFKELESAGVPSRDDNGAIFSRRMMRDAEVRAERAKAGSKGGSKTQAKYQAKLKQTPEDEDEDEEVFKGQHKEFPMALDTDEFRAAWDRWKKHRVEKRSKLTPSTAKEQLKKLASWGSAKAILALNQAIEKGWTGFFEPDERRGLPMPAAPRPQLPNADVVLNRQPSVSEAERAAQRAAFEKQVKSNGGAA